MTTGDHEHLTDELRADGTLGEELLVRVLTSVVRAQSVNPGIYEEAMARRCADWLKATPAEVTFVESLPGRYSVAATLRGRGGGPTLVLNGHMDTVPIDDESLWSVEPFGAQVKDGYVWGRGACDMKAGLAVQIAVAHHLASKLERLRGNLVLHFAVGEECAEPGTLSLVEAGFVGDVGIVTEPTELKVATAERGLAFYRVRIKGRSIHASRAHLGLNPNWALRGVLDVLEEYGREVGQRAHPLLPGGTCTPTVLRAGVKENTVPDYCDLWLDRRLLPGETVDGELEDIRRRLARLRDGDPQFEFEISRGEHCFEPAEIPVDSAFARGVLEAIEEVQGSPSEIYGTPYASDVRNLVNDAGMEAVTFGPGSVTECHCADERVSIDQLQKAALATALVARRLLA